MKTIRNIDQLRAEQLKRSLKKARLEEQMRHRWDQIHRQSFSWSGILHWAIPLAASLFTKKKKHHWYDFLRK